MKIEIEIPDQLVTEALAAAKRVDERKPERERQKGGVKINADYLREVLLATLMNFIVGDIQETAQIELENLIGQKQEELMVLKNNPEG